MHGTRQSDLVKRCAEIHGVSTRSVRNWREANDPRWLDFLARAAVGKAHPTAEQSDDPPEVIGEGIEFEIIRLRSECVALSRRIKNTTDIAAELSLSRMLGEKRETLLRLEKNNPDLQVASGDLVKKTLVVQYAANLLALIRTLPARIASLVPDTVAPEVRTRVGQEVEQFCQLAADLKLDEAA